MENVGQVLNRYTAMIQSMKVHPFRNRKNIKIYKQRIQALGEAYTDIMNTNIANRQSSAGEVDKNNYLTYESKVKGAYDMYEAKTEYGGELFGGVTDCRVSFIGGEGLSVISENETLQDWLDTFIEKNQLNGSRLLAMILTGELEGKNFVRLSSDAKDKIIRVRSFSWYLNKYTLIKDKNDSDIITGIKYRPKTDGVEQDETIIKIDKAVFVRLGGVETVNDETPGRMHKILTQCENASRATYDLRRNTHVFGKYMPYWKTVTAQDAKAINNDLQGKSFEIGDGYAGTADFSIVEPSGAASEAIVKDYIVSMRYISAMSGVPIHWLAFPDLMSNRATADSLLEVINAATLRERLVWTEAFTEVIEKARIMAVDELGEDNAILDGDFTIRLPLISLAMLKQIQETYLPLAEANYISEFTIQNMLPGINPSKERKLIKKQKEEAAKNSPIQNETVNNAINQAQEDNQNVNNNTTTGNKQLPTR
jgi:hypothetical protein